MISKKSSPRASLTTENPFYLFAFWHLYTRSKTIMDGFFRTVALEGKIDVSQKNGGINAQEKNSQREF